LEIIGAQGELRIYRIDAIPEGAMTSPAKNKDGAFILAHSEKGHHHVIGGDVDVIERVSAGFRTLYAIVREPTKLHQTASNAHGDIALAPGMYEIRPDREYDPFLDQIREVQD
jgi:hypothetical protein